MKAIFEKDFLPGSLFLFVTLTLATGWIGYKNGQWAHADAALQSLRADLLGPVRMLHQEPVVVPEDTASEVTVQPKLKALDSISIIGVGDMMLGTNYPSTSYLPPKEGRDLLAPVLHILQNADLTFGNLEGTLFDKGGAPKTCRNPETCYTFRTPAAYADRYLEAGFDLLSIANNHSGDFGPEGRRLTKQTLKEAGIAFAGLAGTDETTVVERNGRKFGMCAFAPNSGTCDLRNIARAQEIVKKLVAECDIVIVSFHGGAEGASHQHVPKQTEQFLGENRGDVYKFAHAVIDAGADVVFGHGPHVTRGMEVYKDRFIAYSLGNFCTYGRFSLSGPAGLAPIAKVVTDAEGRFLKGQLTATYQQKTHGPKIDPQGRVIQNVIQLSKSDFPGSPLVIEPDGRMYLK